MKKKLCIVIQRYGEEIVGGAETYCRIYAEKLSKLYEVEVVTTCAKDYQEWNNYYPAGETEINGVKVRRFRVDFQRDERKFGQLTTKLYNNPHHTMAEAFEWVIAQGPVSSGLINYIKDIKEDTDLFIFMTYLYYHTAMGMENVADKAVLVPFAHDEPPIYLKIYEKIFACPKGMVYNTEEERTFIQTKFKNKHIPSVLTGIGIEIPDKSEYNGCKEKFHLVNPYIVYMGRIDVSKGCDELLDWFSLYKKKYKNNLKLVLMGKEILKVPKSKDIISLGFVSEKEKYDVLSKSIALVLPSHYESLSIVVLEAFALGKPVLVSGHCEVLKGHCIKSNGGLYFYGEKDFEECLQLMYERQDLCKAMGLKGAQYVDKQYRWEVIMEKLNNFIEEMVGD